MINIPEKLILHHTGGTDLNPLADTSNHTFEIVRNYHLSKGWENIGYHWFCDKSGKITKGRDEDYHGAHTTNWNTKSIGFCFAGNFDLTLPTEKQKIAYKQWYKEFIKRWSALVPENVVPHRKYASKTCYGMRLSDEWGQELSKEAIKEPANIVSCEKEIDLIKVLITIIKRLLKI